MKDVLIKSAGRNRRAVHAIALALVLLLAAPTAAAQPQPHYVTGGHHINVARGATPVSDVTATQGDAPYLFSVVAGALPPGISLQSGGQLAGTSTASGAHRFRVRAVDDSGEAGEADFTLVVNPSQRLGTVQSLSFTSPSTGLPVPFTLYLPPGYATGMQRYPVIYHLHGITGAHNGNQSNSVPRSVEAARAIGLVRDAIIVFPDGYNDSFWADSVDGTKPAETHLVDLVSHIDNDYRSIDDVRYRAASGYSMGGFGVAKLVTKFPDRFVTAVIHDAALLDWGQVQTGHAGPALEYFDNSAERFDTFSPWYWLAQNAEYLSGSTRIRASVGALRNYNVAWREALHAADVDIEYVETGLDHVIGLMLDAQGANMWRFIESQWVIADQIFADGLESTPAEREP